MSNKAINQLPNAGTSEDDDVFIIVRSSVNYKITRSNMNPGLLVAQVTIPTAQVLTLFTTPFLIVPAPAADQVIIPLRGLVEFANGSANYATNTTLNLVSTSAPLGRVFQADISDRTVPNALTITSTLTPFPSVAGDSMSLKIETGNPTTGNSDLTVTLWYYLLTV